MKTKDSQVAESKKKEGYRVYKLNGVEGQVVARKGGPTKSQIAKSSSYHSLRQNQKEFGVASMMAKMLRKSLPPVLSGICESYVSGKLTATFRKLAQKEKGKTGTRPLLLSKHGRLLKGFEFNSSYPFKKIFRAKFLLKQGSSRGHFIFHFPSYVPEKQLIFPQGSTHYKLVGHLIAISDFECSAQEKGYLAKAPEFNGKFTTLNSPMRLICRFPLEPATEQLSLSNGKDLSSEAGLLLIMGVHFYRYEKNKYHDLKVGNSMQIYEVF
ncbi:MAG: hypothetical protein O6939_06365 [Bacteroidetes bacterium]|nr:hypothetical protein [Bacteroidota bacterium]